MNARTGFDIHPYAQNEVSPRRVLIVDDHASFRTWARALLEHEGYVVVGEAADGLSAITAVEALQPDVVLLDIRLPDIDGIAVTRLLQYPDGGRPEVVLVSTRDAVEYGARLVSCGARAFIAKADLSPEALTLALRRPW